MNNINPQYIPIDNLVVRQFIPTLVAIDSTPLTTSSPSRILSDIFWQALPWATMVAELGDINVLDVGCGSGGYASKIISWSDARVKSYFGVDKYTHPTWPANQNIVRRISFASGDAERIAAQIPFGTNLIISQSTIEHVPHDMRFFRELGTYIKAYSQSVIQIHLCPSQAGLRLYPLHGVRQYTPRSISRIVEEVSHLAPHTQAYLWQLGGSHCNRVHWSYITKPWLLRRRDRRTQNPAAYAKELRRAITRDAQTPTSSPSFYALVLQSNFNKLIF